MSYGVFAEQRTDSNPYLMGDVFVNEGKEFTLFASQLAGAYGLLNNDCDVSLVVFKNIDRLLDQGFEPVEEYIEMSKEIAENNLYAPRKLKDGTWSAISRLAFTTAVCIDFDDLVAYRTRYCFGNNMVFPSHLTALYWLSRMDSKMSLPVGNCAYRGILGNQPILDAEFTKAYYQKMYDLKYNTMLIDGDDIHGVANKTMIEVFSSITQNKEAIYA